MSNTHPGHKAEIEGALSRRDPALAGTEGRSSGLVAKEGGSSREGGAHGMSLRSDITPAIRRFGRDTCRYFTRSSWA